MKLFSGNTKAKNKDVQASHTDADRLRHALDIERRIANTLPPNADRSIDGQLAAEFERHMKQTEDHLARLEDLLRNLASEAAA